LRTQNCELLCPSDLILDSLVSHRTTNTYPTESTKSAATDTNYPSSWCYQRALCQCAYSSHHRHSLYRNDTQSPQNSPRTAANIAVPFKPQMEVNGERRSAGSSGSNHGTIFDSPCLRAERDRRAETPRGITILPRYHEDSIHTGLSSDAVAFLWTAIKRFLCALWPKQIVTIV
jgi:hypothetical protein